MTPRLPPWSGGPRAGLLARLGRVGLLLLPALLLLGAALRQPPSAQDGLGLLWLGLAFQALACLLALVSRPGQGEPAGPAVIMLYVIALGWLLVGTPGWNDWFLHVAQATLLVVPLGFFAVQCLRDSGAPALRRARHLARRLAVRPNWPGD